MFPILKFIWPFSVAVLLVFLVIQYGGMGVENPLGDHAVERWLSISRR